MAGSQLCARAKSRKAVRLAETRVESATGSQQTIDRLLGSPPQRGKEVRGTYDSSQLGRQQFCPPSQAHSILRQTTSAFRRQQARPAAARRQTLSTFWSQSIWTCHSFHRYSACSFLDSSQLDLRSRIPPNFSLASRLCPPKWIPTSISTMRSSIT